MKGFVEYRLPDFPAAEIKDGKVVKPGVRQLRTAVVTRDWGGSVNLRVFLDPTDLQEGVPLGSCGADGVATSVPEGDDVGQHRDGRFYPR